MMKNIPLLFLLLPGLLALPGSSGLGLPSFLHLSQGPDTLRQEMLRHLKRTGNLLKYITKGKILREHLKKCIQTNIEAKAMMLLITQIKTSPAK